MTQASYAISHWPDTEAILENINRLVNQPMRPIRRDKMKEYLSFFETRCRRSKELTDEAKKYIPGGIQHNLAFNYPFPLAVAKAQGPYLWDVDSNRYIDFLQAGGPTILGSNYEPVQKKILELIQGCGPVTGLFHEYELKLARLINRHMPNVELFRMLGSGTESVIAAIRAARCFTGKSKVIKVGGGYHGWSDQMVFGLHIPGTGAYEAHGIPSGCLETTQEFFPNNTDDDDGLYELLKRNEKDGGTAAVIVEPLGPESGTRPVLPEFNRRVRELCDEFDTLLIFDEVVTGFRMGLGGAQGYFNIKPDLTVFGKCVAGGYPAAGGIGGRRDVMSTLAAGVEAGKPRAYVGGTLSANPLSCAAGYYSILEIEKNNAPVKAGRAGDRLCEGLKKIITRYRLPFVAFNHGSICHLETSGVMLLDITNPNIFTELSPRKHMMEEMGAAFMAEGIISLAGSRLYTSMADTNDVIDEALDGFDRVFQHIEGVDR
ncbi:MAG TPA: aminotransferase class III-fold pyridoxal phosphate-dependent enzyme [Syntrophales bacterium]|nr:aminotransferase class III-fold pyridoxal phosphate-dependent enzyme [Syntrophales bacterium]HPQ44404.1 aminotransferase class III-fold pyridoxal phosphate-dependent enzyme [Syntrophales bacterium]